jgi:SAM-dependent methyltransferase
LPGPDELLELFRTKYGGADGAGPAPYRRWRYGYWTPDDVYEALISALVTPACRWLDVGGGRDLFPTNPRLAGDLAERVGRLVGVDPSPNVHENPFAHEKVQSPVEDYTSAEPFNLITLRMVAEHLSRPDDAVAAITRLTATGGRVVVLTVNLYTPVAAAAWAVPFRFHHRIKRVLWGTEEKDTFPVAYKMNSRSALDALFRRHGFREAAFAYLDDCRTFARFRLANHAELSLRWAMHKAGLRYPENCLLGVYEKRHEVARTSA